MKQRRAKKRDPSAVVSPSVGVSPRVGSYKGCLYRAGFDIIAMMICRVEGFSIKRLAEVFSVSVKTIYNWMEANPGFQAAVEHGRDWANAQVENALFRRALGYDYEDIETAEKVLTDGTKVVATKVTKRHLPADVKAAQIWLYNRKREFWKQQPFSIGEQDINGPFIIINTADKISNDMRAPAPVPEGMAQKHGESVSVVDVSAGELKQLSAAGLISIKGRGGNGDNPLDADLLSEDS